MIYNVPNTATEHIDVLCSESPWGQGPCLTGTKDYFNPYNDFYTGEENRLLQEPSSKVGFQICVYDQSSEGEDV
jgi:hypothetical protein